MKIGLMCLLLLPACSFLWPSPDDPKPIEYVLTWYCISPEGCEHVDEAARIDRATHDGADFDFTSTQDPSFRLEALRIFSQTLPYRCSWLHDLIFFGQALERSMICSTAGGFELELTIPNEDATTSSMWLVEGRDVDLL